MGKIVVCTGMVIPETIQSVQVLKQGCSNDAYDDVVKFSDNMDNILLNLFS